MILKYEVMILFYVYNIYVYFYLKLINLMFIFFFIRMVEYKRVCLERGEGRLMGVIFC